MTRALIFDCDGVLADTERHGHLVAFNALFSEEGFDLQWSTEEYAELLKIGGGKERMLSVFSNPDFVARYVPLCHFPDHLDQISEIREVATFRTRHWAPDFKNDDVGAGRAVAGRSKPAKCAGCSLFDRCEGVWNEYLKRVGDDELKPLVHA